MSAILKRFIPAASNASSVLRTRTAAVSVRMLSDGSTARDPGWSKKEKAVEDQYAHNREVEAIEKMKKMLDTKAKELAEREKELQQREKELGK